MVVVSAVILAAGSSTRMGRPKLLLPLEGLSLVRRVAQESVASRVEQTIVVTGAYRDGVVRELAGLPIELVHNPEHEQGMSTSLRAGLGALKSDAEAAIVLLADQPLIDRTVLDGLIGLYVSTGAPIVRPSYAGTPGNPVLWDRALFGALMLQEGDKGGRDLLGARRGEVAYLSVADSSMMLDVDTPEAYEAVRGSVERADPAGATPTTATPSHVHAGTGPSFCPRCAGRLSDRLVQDRVRPVCEACGAVFWIDPKVAVAVIVPWECGVLLGRRAIEPGLGLWSFPSGYVDRGEVPEEAARREVWEETKLDVRISGLVGVYATAGDPVILIVYAAEVVSGDAQPGPEMTELAGFRPGRFPPMAFDHDVKIVGDWLAWRHGEAVVG